MSTPLDYYTLLGINRDATQDEVKQAYFDAVQHPHPDKNEASGETEIFENIQQAYDLLSNPEKRAKYDATLVPEEEIISPIVHRVLYSRQSLVRLNETQLIYALLEWKSRENETEVISPPLNICLVLDCSTSMKGSNIEMAKAAAIHLVRSLRQQDIFSIVTFSDRAQVIVPSSLKPDRQRMETQIRRVNPSGGTEILQGLLVGVEEVRRNLSDEWVNHVILLTDGQTYGDETEALALAERTAELGIGISGLGIGQDWNDDFLDELAAKTGSSSSYIAEPQDIQSFLEEKFRQLTKVFAENAELTIKNAPNIDLTYAFRLQPNATHLSAEKTIQLGVILRDKPLSLLLEFEIKPDAILQDEAELLNGSLKFDIPSKLLATPPMRVRLSRNVTEKAILEPPSPTLIQALANLNLYRMQEKAQEEADAGNYNEASIRLQRLATHLLSQGESSMANTIILEAENLQNDQRYSKEGRKNIKYGTRALVLPVEKGKT